MKESCFRWAVYTAAGCFGIAVLTFGAIYVLTPETFGVRRGGAAGGRLQTAAGEQEPTQVVEGSDAHFMHQEYAADVIAYRKKYGGKLVSLRLDPPVSIAEDARGPYVPQQYGVGADYYSVKVYLRPGDAEALSRMMQAGKPRPKLRVIIDGRGFGFHGGRLITG